MGGKRANNGKDNNRQKEIVEKEAQSDDEYFSNSQDEEYVPKINMMCKTARYIEIKEAANQILKFHLSRSEKCDWDIWWSENQIDSNLAY